jgi:hypothetical protein
MRLFFPRHETWYPSRKQGLSGNSGLTILPYDSPGIFNELILDPQENGRTVLVLTNREMANQEYVAILRQFRDSKWFYSLGIVCDDFAQDLSSVLSLVDWILVETREFYDALRKEFMDKLLCLPSWRGSMRLHRIIADYGLFYKRTGKSGRLPVGKHRRYGNDKTLR